ncbi:uncharacterized protein BKCO1_930001 [Diplodia corticola]|uniref:NmrA-like domain-containing protein n=1 Tax=Diplodia corticola TaxID=236234 RepID=A0A1J9RND6_9PEZI|nr:uncharacterized protein BKCO1_930001 [Diplodia corticola]OJD29109.1 hypothetical protein BKCO1_930001 [Diplodia corticola]
MASPIKNVVLIGAGGNLGPYILKEFLAAPGLNVNVLSRPDSKSTFPADVTVLKSDYTVPSLTSAFRSAHADVVVSLVGTPGFGAQQAFIDAAIAAGVRRFVPSEFGSDTSNKAVLSLVPFLNGKREVVDYLKSKEGAIEWTGVVTGPFFDWGLKVGFLGFDVAGRKASVWDGGVARWGTTNVKDIGRALVGLVTRGEAWEKSANRYVYVAGFVVTQKEVLAAFEKVTGEKWSVEEVSVEARAKAAREGIEKGDFGKAADLLLAATFGKEELGTLPELWNEVVGLPAKGDLELTVKEVVEGKRP